MKIGFLSVPLTGHLNPMTALARTLEFRGHEVLFFGVPDVEPVIRAANLRFVPFCEKHYPIGSTEKIYRSVAKLQGDDVLRQHLGGITPSLLHDMPDCLHKKLEETNVDAMVLDKGHSFMELVPISLGIPFVHIWNTLHIDTSGATPPCLFSWPYENTPEAHARNIEGLIQVGGYFASIVAAAKAYADRVGLAIDWSDPRATSSKLAEITQTPREFDFPGISWPSTFHYAGPSHDGEGRQSISFRWERLEGRPLVYASLGTLVNGIERLYNTILHAVENLHSVQVVLSIGKNVNLSDLRSIPSNTIAVQSAPQIELLKRAALCITHAGMNTVLECLAQGVPMVALPITYDQPGIAARIAYHGVGEFLELDHLDSHTLSDLVVKVLGDPKYRDKAQYFQKVIAETHGLDLASTVIERAFMSALGAPAVGS
jgi:MGT family glycosyltransferase